MRKILFTALLLSCAVANARVYKCPQDYPGKDAPAAPLTGASMRWGALHGDGWLTGDDEAAMEGYDVHYGFADDEQAWLVCSYGGKKRIKGRMHDGHEWNQSMEWGGIEWWMKMAPKVGLCTVQVREIKSRDQGGRRTWTATADCK